MRATKRFERRITTPYFKVGTLKKVVGEGSVNLSKLAGLPFERLRLCGNMELEIPNRAELYKSYLTNESRYVSAGVNGAYSIALPAEFIGKELTYTVTVKANVGGASLYLADGNSALFNNLTPLAISGSKTHTVKGSTFTHLIFTNVETSDKETDDGAVVLVRDGIISFWQTHDISVTSEPTPNFYSPITVLGNGNARLVASYDGKNKFIILPASLLADETVTLRLSRYDEIVVDRKKQSVIYRDGTAVFDLTGNENWKIHESVAAQGKGVFAYATMSAPFTEGYCPYLTFAPWIPSISQKNVFSVFNGTNLAIKLESNETDPAKFKSLLAEIVNMLKTRSASGAGVSIYAKRRQVIGRDISNTSFGKTLLAFTAPRNTEPSLALRNEKLEGYLDVEYYALESGEDSILTVICKNENGQELLLREHTIRRGSAYKLSVPEIDGYEPCEPTLFGALTENKTVVIEYKEKK